jgi:hypothetical protein
VAPQERGNDVGIGHDAGDVGRRRKGANAHAAISGGLKQAFELHQIGAAIGRLVDFDDLGATFAPGQDIGMVFIGTDEHDRLLAARRGLGHIEQMDQPIKAGGSA